MWAQDSIRVLPLSAATVPWHSQGWKPVATLPTQSEERSVSSHFHRLEFRVLSPHAGLLMSQV